MRTSGNFKDILRRIEEGPASKADAEKLMTYIKVDNVYGPVFKGYIKERLKNNIHPERLLRLANHFEKLEETYHFSKMISEQLVHSIIENGENYDQFYYMNRHDTRDLNHVFTELMFRLGILLNEKAVAVIENIAPILKQDKYSLMLRAIKSYEVGAFRLTLFLDKLAVEDQYNLLSKAFQEDSPIALRLMRGGNFKLNAHIDQQIVAKGDQDTLMSAIRNTGISIVDLETNDFLNYLIDTYSKDLPATLGRLYVRAEQEGRYDYLISLCHHKNKKDVLRTICKAEDKELIDRFFSIYKNSPEVKHLVPFL